MERTKTTLIKREGKNRMKKQTTSGKKNNAPVKGQTPYKKHGASCAPMPKSKQAKKK